MTRRWRTCVKSYRRTLLPFLFGLLVFHAIVWSSSTQHAAAETRSPATAKPPVKPEPPVVVQPGSSSEQPLSVTQNNQAATAQQPSNSFAPLNYVTGVPATVHPTATEPRSSDGTLLANAAVAGAGLVLIIAAVLAAAGIAFTLSADDDQIFVNQKDIARVQQALSSWAQAAATWIGQTAQQLYEKAIDLIFPIPQAPPVPQDQPAPQPAVPPVTPPTTPPDTHAPAPRPTPQVPPVPPPLTDWNDINRSLDDQLAQLNDILRRLDALLVQPTVAFFTATQQQLDQALKLLSPKVTALLSAAAQLASTAATLTQEELASQQKELLRRALELKVELKTLMVAVAANLSGEGGRHLLAYATTLVQALDEAMRDIIIADDVAPTQPSSPDDLLNRREPAPSAPPPSTNIPEEPVPPVSETPPATDAPLEQPTPDHRRKPDTDEPTSDDNPPRVPPPHAGGPDCPPELWNLLRELTETNPEPTLPPNLDILFGDDSHKNQTSNILIAPASAAEPVLDADGKEILVERKLSVPGLLIYNDPDRPKLLTEALLRSIDPKLTRADLAWMKNLDGTSLIRALENNTLWDTYGVKTFDRDASGAPVVTVAVPARLVSQLAQLTKTPTDQRNTALKKKDPLQIDIIVPKDKPSARDVAFGVLRFYFGVDEQRLVEILGQPKVESLVQQLIRGGNLQNVKASINDKGERYITLPVSRVLDQQLKQLYELNKSRISTPASAIPNSQYYFGGRQFKLWLQLATPSELVAWAKQEGPEKVADRLATLLLSGSLGDFRDPNSAEVLIKKLAAIIIGLTPEEKLTPLKLQQRIDELIGQNPQAAADLQLVTTTLQKMFSSSEKLLEPSPHTDFNDKEIFATRMMQQWAKKDETTAVASALLLVAAKSRLEDVIRLLALGTTNTPSGDKFVTRPWQRTQQDVVADVLATENKPLYGMTIIPIRDANGNLTGYLTFSKNDQTMETDQIEALLGSTGVSALEETQKWKELLMIGHTSIGLVIFQGLANSFLPEGRAATRQAGADFANARADLAKTRSKIAELPEGNAKTALQNVDKEFERAYKSGKVNAEETQALQDAVQCILEANDPTTRALLDELVQNRAKVYATEQVWKAKSFPGKLWPSRDFLVFQAIWNGVPYLLSLRSAASWSQLSEERKKLFATTISKSFPSDVWVINYVPASKGEPILRLDQPGELAGLTDEAWAEAVRLDASFLSQTPVGRDMTGVFLIDDDRGVKLRDLVNVNPDAVKTKPIEQPRVSH